MYIEPNTNIRILKNVPLDNTYNHSLFFSSETQQTSYFSTLTKYTFTNQSYQRVKRGFTRVEKKSELLYDCNYIMFQNSSFGTKWFYGFIKSVEYVNNAVSEIEFEIDVIQTWLFDFNLKQCYVEREHVSSDEKWSHLVNEPFPLGDTTYQQISKNPVGSDWSLQYVIFSTYVLGTGSIVKSTGGQYNGTMYGTSLYLAKNETELSYLIEELKKTADDSIVAIQSIPRFLADKLTTVATYKISNKSYSTKEDFSLAYSHDTIGSYKPRNNKCFNFPYYGFFVSNQQGLSDVLDFANFENAYNISAVLYGDICLNSSCIVSFKNYKKLSIYHEYDLQSSQFPQVQYNSSNYNYFEQQQSQAKFSALVGGVNQAISTSPLGSKIGNGGVGIISTMGNLEFMKSQQANTPPTVHTLVGNSTLMCNIGGQEIICGIRHMKIELIKLLDEFFDMYGYQVNTLKKPNISARKKWNYVKTSGCVITGSVPADDMKKICSIFDNGVTFWKNGDDVGNYSLDNSL